MDEQEAWVIMKIAVFYENIWEGVKEIGADMRDTLQKLREAGMELIYISADSWKRDGKALAPILREMDIGVEGMHAFLDFPRGASEQDARAAVDLALEAGAGNLLIVPGFLSTGNSVRDMDAILCGMRLTAAYGKEKGLPILMEDFDGLSAPYNCMAGLKYFFDRAPEVDCAFDTGNFVAFREDELAAFDLFADRIKTLHLKDRAFAPRHERDTAFTCADQTRVYCCAVGSGEIRIAEILKRLKARGYPGNVIIELYCCDARYVLSDLLSSVRWVRETIHAG